MLNSNFDNEAHLSAYVSDICASVCLYKNQYLPVGSENVLLQSVCLVLC